MTYQQTPKLLPYKHILSIAMLFITIDLAAVAVAYKMVSINDILKLNSAATFIFPLTYCVGDVVSEVYGYRMAKSLILNSLLLQILFGILVTCVIYLPSPENWPHQASYQIVFSSILRFILAGTIANLVSSLLNVYIVSRLKIPFEGKLFWLRSILSTIFGGFIMVAIIMVSFVGDHITTFDQILVMFKSTFSLEVIYAVLLAVPASIIASFLKRSEKIDTYDYNTNYNPFSFKF